ncbi:MAG: hypothetical protein HEQ32_00335 [Vampirovibrio sp.]
MTSFPNFGLRLNSNHFPNLPLPFNSTDGVPQVMRNITDQVKNMAQNLGDNKATQGSEIRVTNTKFIPRPKDDSTIKDVKFVEVPRATEPQKPHWTTLDAMKQSSMNEKNQSLKDQEPLKPHWTDLDQVRKLQSEAIQAPEATESQKPHWTTLDAMKQS